jgi:predicted aspartyl protease
MAKIGRNEPCHCGSGKKFKKCHGGVQAPVRSDREMLGDVRAQGFRVSQNFRDADRLLSLGPVIRGEWRLSPDDERNLIAGGGPVPPPVKGYFLIDTGASFTSIDGSVARELNLPSVGLKEASGIEGAGMFETYRASILLYVESMNGERLAIGLHKDFLSAPVLRQVHDSFNLTAPDGSPLRVIGLLGRDFLQFATLNYDGLAGSWDMTIDPAVMQPWNVAR